MYEALIEPIHKLTSAVTENIVTLIFSETADLRRAFAPTAIDLPRDLYAHSDVQTEWWYYTGHCKTEQGKAFGFELAFFKRRTDLDTFGLIPLRFVANPMYAAHFALSEIDTGKFQYDHIRSFGSLFDLPVKMCEDEYFLMLGDWSIVGEDDKHVLHATFQDGLTLDAVLAVSKPPVLHGHDGRGVSERTELDASNHFSITRMAIVGTIEKNGRKDEFTGTGWMDREFGTWEQAHWDWFSIQFEDDTELMIYHLRDIQDQRRKQSHGRFVEADGGSCFLHNDDFELIASGEWTSGQTGATYPNGWVVRIPKLGMDLQITPLIEHQELDTRGTTMVVYWEGVCRVTGTRSGRPVKGNSYVELVGYDRSHENPSMISFFLGKSLQL